METRSVRTPLSIKIAMALTILGVAFTAWGTSTFLAVREPTPLWIALVAQNFAMAAYQLWALPRMSRWAPIAKGTVGLALLPVRWAYDAPPDVSFASLTSIVVPLATYMALVLPHWRKMNWAPLGLPYRPASNPADVF